MKILQVLRAPVGGLFRHVCDLSVQLHAKGHEVGIVVDALSFDRETKSKLSKIEHYLDLGIHPIAMPRLFGLQDLSAPFKIRQLIKDYKIDVVHGHGAKGGFHARLGAIGQNDVKKIYTPHGGVLHFAATSLAGRVFHFLEQKLVAQSDHIIFESAFAQKSYADQICDVGEKGEVIHNGLPQSEFDNIASTDAFDFVFIGEMRDLKGVEYLLRALVGVKSANKVQANLLLIGDGPHRERFEALSHELRITDHVEFAGAQPAKNGFMQTQNVVVPSLKESLPYIVMEAVAAGKHVIATDIGGIGEIFGPEKSHLIPAANVEALRDALKLALEPTPALYDHRNRLNAYVKNNFSIDKMTVNILSKYFD